MTIRPATMADRDALYAICRQTADTGADASARFGDPDLLGHVWVGPYLALAPELAFILDDDEGVAGYIVGALDTPAFESATERDWWPALRATYGASTQWQEPDASLVRHIEKPPLTPASITTPFPSHLHINQLPRTRGRGHGRRLIETLVHELRSHGSTGLHLGVAMTNAPAQAFYGKVGFLELPESTPQTQSLGMPITPTLPGRQ